MDNIVGFELSQKVESLDQLNQIAQRFAKWLADACSQQPIDLVLAGPLGAGKTTFVSLLLKHLGCCEQVSSPTYVLSMEYKTNLGLVEHWDVYRLTQLIEDLIQPSKEIRLRLVEWGDKFPEFSNQAQGLVEFFLEFAEEDFVVASRRIKIKCRLSCP